MDGVYALDDVSIGPAKVKQFAFLYANKISQRNSNDTSFIPGADGIVGLSPQSSSLGYYLIQEVIKYCQRLFIF